MDYVQFLLKISKKSFSYVATSWYVLTTPFLYCTIELRCEYPFYVVRYKPKKKKLKMAGENELIFRSERINGIQVNLAARSWHIVQDILY